MNICVNYWGQPRQLNIIEDIYKNQINDNINNFHICYSTWKTENIENFKKIFPNAYIKQYDFPDLSLYNNIIDNYHYDDTTVSRDIKNYILGIYILEQSLKTINEFKEMNNVNFNFIITIRPDTDIYNGTLFSYYSDINNNINNDNNTFYTANSPRFDVYNEGAVPNALFISNLHNMSKLLTFPDFKNISIMQNIIHPETAAGKNIKYNKFNLKYLNLYAFRWQPIRFYTFSHFKRHPNVKRQLLVYNR